jgi:hypothetical protein
VTVHASLVLTNGVVLDVVDCPSCDGAPTMLADDTAAACFTCGTTAHLADGDVRPDDTPSEATKARFLGYHAADRAVRVFAHECKARR